MITYRPSCCNTVHMNLILSRLLALGNNNCKGRQPQRGVTVQAERRSRYFARLSMESKESHVAFSLFGEALQGRPPG